MRKHHIFYTILGILAIAGLFIFVSYLVQNNIVGIQKLIGDNIYGKIIYILLLIASIVLAPITVIPFIPIASNQWGWFETSLLTIFGWTAGSIIAFFIARVYGKKVVEKFISLKKIRSMERMIPKKNEFLGIIVLRVTFPVDFLSYAIGLLSRIDWKSYSLATLIGVTPGAVVLSYIGELPFSVQLSAFIIGTIIFILIVVISLGYHEKIRKSLEKTWKGRFGEMFSFGFFNLVFKR